MHDCAHTNTYVQSHPFAVRCAGCGMEVFAAGYQEAGLTPQPGDQHSPPHAGYLPLFGGADADFRRKAQR